MIHRQGLESLPPPLGPPFSRPMIEILSVFLWMIVQVGGACAVRDGGSAGDDRPCLPQPAGRGRQRVRD